MAGGVVRVSFEWGCGDMQGVCSKRACGDESAPKTLAFPTRAPTAGPSNKVVESTNTVAAPVSGARVAALGVVPVLQLVALVPRSVNDVPLLHASVLSVWPAQSESPVNIPVWSTHPLGAHPNMSCKARSVPALPAPSSQSAEGRG